jgi:hypothetical protein
VFSSSCVIFFLYSLIHVFPYSCIPFFLYSFVPVFSVCLSSVAGSVVEKNTSVFYFRIVLTMIAHFVKLVSLLDVSPFSPTAVSLEEFLRVYHALNSLNMVDYLAWEFATMADKSLCEQDLGKDGVIVLYSAGVGFSETL